MPKKRKHNEEPEREEVQQFSHSQSSTVSGQSCNSQNEWNKALIFEFFASKLNESQESLYVHGKLLHEVKSFYYKENDDPKKAASYQNHCAISIWRIMLVPFSSERTNYMDSVIKFFTRLTLSLGTEKDMKEYKYPLKDLPPFFVHVIKFSHQCHLDTRANVRARIMDITKQILMTFHDHPKLSQDSELSSKILEVLFQRLKDKLGSIRSTAAQCLHYFLNQKEVRRVLAQVGRCDSSVEVRKQAFQVLSKSSAIKAAYFVGQAYNVCENVRVEAFIALSKVPLSKIPNKQERQKLILWGLSQPSLKVQDTVRSVLLPAWLEMCQNNVLQLVTKLNPSEKIQVTRIIVNAIYRDKLLPLETEERSILNSDNIVPLKEATVLKNQLWFILCETFKDQPESFRIVCPGPDIMCELLKEYLVSIRQGEETDNIEASEIMSSLHLCLVQVLRIAKLINYEEGARCQIVEILNQLLVEPKIVSSVILFEIVHLLFLKTKDICEFRTIIESALSDILDPYKNKKGNSNPPSDIATSSNVEVAMKPLTSSTPKKLGRRLDSERQVIECSPNNQSIHVSSSDSRNTSQFDSLRIQLAEVLLQKHKLISRKEYLVAEGNFVGANQVHTELELIKEEVERLKRSNLDKSSCSSSKLTCIVENEDKVASPEENRLNILNDQYVEETIGTRSIQNQMSLGLTEFLEEDSEEEHFILSDIGILRGLIILTKYLSCGGKLTTDFLRDLHDNYLLHYLTNESKIVRKYVLYVMYFVAIMEEQQARKAMQVSITALKGDPDKCVQHAAFKCIVDLLTHYEPRTFVQSEIFDEFCPMQPPLNNPNASSEEIETMFLGLLRDSFTESQTQYDTLLKLKASTNLLLADRFTFEDSLIDLMLLHVDPIFGASLNAFHIGYFLPIYISLSLRNGTRVINAFVESLKVIYDRREDPKDSLFRIDPTKFINFIIQNTDSNTLVELSDSHKLHEYLALHILRKIDRNVKWMHNCEIAKILKGLVIQSKECASQMTQLIDEILEKLQPLLQSVNISKLKSTLRNQVKDLLKRFPPMDSEEVLPVEPDVEIEENISINAPDQKEKSLHVEPDMEIEENISINAPDQEEKGLHVEPDMEIEENISINAPDQEEKGLRVEPDVEIDENISINAPDHEEKVDQNQMINGCIESMDVSGLEIMKQDPHVAVKLQEESSNC